jgi:hypothetical protein
MVAYQQAHDDAAQEIESIEREVAEAADPRRRSRRRWRSAAGAAAGIILGVEGDPQRHWRDRLQCPNRTAAASTMTRWEVMCRDRTGALLPGRDTARLRGVMQGTGVRDADRKRR